jgi:hypothetical protein
MQAHEAEFEAWEREEARQASDPLERMLKIVPPPGDAQ